jgi:hypothetical protein
MKVYYRAIQGKYEEKKHVMGRKEVRKIIIVVELDEMNLRAKSLFSIMVKICLYSIPQ